VTEPPATGQLCDLTAVELAALLAAGEVSAREVLEAHLDRIERVNPDVNAIVTLVPDLALARAAALDERLAAGEKPGLLHGLPVAHKDLADTAGVRTTYGSPIFADHVPDHDALIVERMAGAGAVMVGKTNTPELGAGSQTFNAVFGTTRNPYDLERTCGGSSGGAAVSLACGMVALADGSDMGGSLRNPAAFCNVVGLRPSPGRVPHLRSLAPWSPLSVDGPMGRTVDDVSLLLSAVAGPDPRSALALGEAGSNFAPPLRADLTGTRVAWSPDCSGLPVDPDVRDALSGVPDVLSDLGCIVVEGWPDLSAARDVFQTLRAWQFEVVHGPLLDRWPDRLKDTIVWNITEARRRDLADHALATRTQGLLLAEVAEFMQHVDVLAGPVTQVPPFDLGTEWVSEVDGVAMDTYIDWMRSCSDVTVTGLPALSLPFGFTAAGLPVGLQLVGQPRGERDLLACAAAIEAAVPAGRRRPPILSTR
jgi:amidase